MSFYHDSHGSAAQVFAEAMVDAEWMKYDLKYADKLSKQPVEVRLGDKGEIKKYRIPSLRLSLQLKIEEV